MYISFSNVLVCVSVCTCLCMKKNSETTTSLSLTAGFTRDVLLHLYTFPNRQNSLL